MRNNLGIKSNGEKSLSDKIIMYSCIGVAVLVVILGGLLIYSKNLSDEVKDETMSLEQMAAIAGNNTSNESSSTTEDGTNTQSASTQIGKSVEESENEKEELQNKLEICKQKLSDNESIITSNNEKIADRDNTLSAYENEIQELSAEKAIKSPSLAGEISFPEIFALMHAVCFPDKESMRGKAMYASDSCGRRNRDYHRDCHQAKGC